MQRHANKVAQPRAPRIWLVFKDFSEFSIVPEARICRMAAALRASYSAFTRRCPDAAKPQTSSPSEFPMGKLRAQAQATPLPRSLRVWIFPPETRIVTMSPNCDVPCSQYATMSHEMHSSDSYGETTCLRAEISSGLALSRPPAKRGYGMRNARTSKLIGPLRNDAFT